MRTLLICATLLATLAITGCTTGSDRHAVVPTYSYRKAHPDLSAERIWPVTSKAMAKVASETR